MKRILSGVMIAFLFCAVATVAFSASAAKTVVRKSPGSPPDRKLIHDCASCHTLSKEEAGTIFKGLGEVTEVKTSPVKGLYEVTVKQKNRQAVAYLDFSKKLLVPGPVFDIATKRPITPPPIDLPKILSKAELEKIPLTDSIVMGNPAGKKRIFIFTDPDCPFCARLHAELKRLVTMEPDVAVFIKMYPLKMHPKAHDKARVILGAGAKGVEMLEKAFSEQSLPEPGPGDPDKPVSETIVIAESIGIHSTPTIVFPDGSVIAGARDAVSIRELLEKSR